MARIASARENSWLCEHFGQWLTWIPVAPDAVHTVLDVLRSGSWVSGHSKIILIIVTLLSLGAASA